MDDVIGSVQQIEVDVLAVDVLPDEPKCLEAKISNVQVSATHVLCYITLQYDSIQCKYKFLWRLSYIDSGSLSGELCEVGTMIKVICLNVS